MKFLRLLWSGQSTHTAPLPRRTWSMPLDDRLDFACLQLFMVQESTGKVTEGNVRRAAADWADENNGEQYNWLKINLMEMVTA